jgi:heat shock protein HslJ
MKCLQVKNGKSWNLWYAPIEGFTYIPGNTYRIAVISVPVENPPMDTSSHRYVLKKILATSPLRDTSWSLVSWNGKAVTESVSLEFKKNTLSAKICNTISGKFSIRKNTISAPHLASTRMMCQGGIMDIENAFDLDAATFSLKDGILTVITEKKNTFVWKQK